MTITDTAHQFFDACETGKGWAACAPYCHDGATFACQADTLAEVTTLEAYTEWMQGLFTPLPDAHYELTALATDQERATVVAAAVIHATQTGEGGPVPPTGKTIAGDYVYVMQFDGAKIRHMTKIWNDAWSLRALGWA